MRRFERLIWPGVLLLLGRCDVLLRDSKAPRAHGTLFIDTDDPAYPPWQTRVEFSPE